MDGGKDEEDDGVGWWGIIYVAGSGGLRSVSQEWD